MSGICGIVNLDGSPAKPRTLEAMARAAPHRGPDGVRHHVEANVGLAHLALNVTPESFRESQPVAEGDLLLVSDARIDNREELVGLLGSSLKKDSPTDADLILAAYRRWGTDCPSRLIGDFAFCVWDGRRGKLLAARDPMAMRALYYRVDAGRRFLFGTEAKQILAAPGVPRRVFEPAVGAHLAGPYGRPEWSFYEGISQLAPAHALTVDESGLRTWRYWDVDPDRCIEYRTEEEYVEHFFEVFAEAVRCRLRSERPVGISLSGGMDSGSMASVGGRLMGWEKHAPPELRAYSWAFEEHPGCDERHISGEIVRHYGLPVTEVAADEAWPLKDYPAHGPDPDEPFIWVYQTLIERTLAAARSEGMKTMLSGDRGDEMVGDWVFDLPGLLLAGRLRDLRRELVAFGDWNGEPPAQAALGRLLKPLLSNAWPKGATWAIGARRSLRRSEPPPTPYPDWVRPEFAGRINLAEIVEESRPQFPVGDQARRMRYERVFSFASSRIALSSERTQARFGLGFADPWSDRRLAEFVLAAPQWRIQRVGESKRIAREAMRGVMPESVRRKAGKIEPVSLFDLGFKVREKDTVYGLISDSRAASLGYLDADKFRESYESFLRDEPPRFDFWWTLTLEMWLRRHWP